jgi:hypothetical protein
MKTRLLLKASPTLGRSVASQCVLSELESVTIMGGGVPKKLNDWNSFSRK